jgi:hypothetical protein
LKSPDALDSLLRAGYCEKPVSTFLPGALAPHLNKRSVRYESLPAGLTSAMWMLQPVRPSIGGDLMVAKGRLRHRGFRQKPAQANPRQLPTFTLLGFFCFSLTQV